jgi:hypothetical protein
MFKKVLLAGAFLTTLASVSAMSPTLQLSSTGSGDTVSIQVAADANTPLVLYYKSTSTGTTQGTTVGTSDANGSFTTTLSTASLGVDSSVPVYVIANGYVSNSTVWPYASASSTAAFSLTQSALTMYMGQSATVTATGTGSYYITNASNTSVASVSISGSTVNISALTAGTDVVTICQSSTECTNLTVTVNAATATATTTSTLVMSPVLTAGQTLTYILSGGVSPYYLTNTSNGIFTATVSGTSLAISALAQGYASTSVCSVDSSCTPIWVTVNGVAPASVSTAAPSSSTKYVFNNPLKFGMVGQEVIELQKRLQLEGYFPGSFSAHFGAATLAAVKAYQKDHGLSALGNVGPGTRTELNK